MSRKNEWYWGIKHMKVYSFVGLYLEAHERKYVLHMSIRPWKKTTLPISMIPKVRNYISIWLTDETSNDSSSFLHSDQEKTWWTIQCTSPSCHVLLLSSVILSWCCTWPTTLDWDQTPTHQPQIIGFLVFRFQSYREKNILLNEYTKLDINLCAVHMSLVHMYTHIYVHK